MASKKEKDEAFNEEFNRVDQELKKLQLELSDLHQHHDDMVQKLAAKVRIYRYFFFKPFIYKPAFNVS